MWDMPADAPLNLASSARGPVRNARAGLVHCPEPDSTLPGGSGPSPAERIASPQPETGVQCPGNLSSDPSSGAQTQNTDSRQHLPGPSTIAIMSVLRNQSTSNADSIWRDRAVLAAKHTLQSFILSAQALEDMISVSPVMGSMRMLIAVAPDSGHGTSNGGIILWNSIEGTSLPSVSPISGSGLAPSLDVPSVQDGVDRTARNVSSSMRPQLETTGNIPFLTSHARGRSVQETALRNVIDFYTPSLETMLLAQNARTTLTTGISLDCITSTPFYRASLPSSRRGTDGGFHIPLDLPQNVAVYVANMLLKGSGIFTHNNEQSHLSLFETYSKLNGRALEDFVQRLFQMMKLSSTSSSSRSKITKYKQLISEGIRDREVVLVLSRDSAGNVIRSETEKLSLMKLKTTNKFQWFAGLCSAILSPQSPSACKQLLQDYAREGAGELGCARRAQFGEVRSCQLQLSCIAHDWEDYTVQGFPLKLNEFWFVGDGSRNVAGLCHVTVTVASSSEKTLGNSSVCITLREVFMPEKQYRMHDEALREDDLQPQEFLPSDIVSMGQNNFISLRHLLNCTLTWDVGGVERVKVICNGKDMIGYAVLVSELGTRARATRTAGGSPENEESALPVSVHQIPRNAYYAVLIHDLRLTSRIKNYSVWYPYHEWYDGRRLKVFKEPHFGKDNVPKFLDDKRLGKYKTLLWHMDWIKGNTTEI